MTVKRQIGTISAHAKRSQEKAAPYGCVYPRRSSSKRSKRWKLSRKVPYLAGALPAPAAEEREPNAKLVTDSSIGGAPGEDGAAREDPRLEQ